MGGRGDFSRGDLRFRGGRERVGLGVVGRWKGSRVEVEGVGEGRALLRDPEMKEEPSYRYQQGGQTSSGVDKTHHKHIPVFQKQT